MECKYFEGRECTQSQYERYFITADCIPCLLAQILEKVEYMNQKLADSRKNPNGLGVLNPKRILCHLWLKAFIITTPSNIFCWLDALKTTARNHLENRGFCAVFGGLMA